MRWTLLIINRLLIAPFVWSRQVSVFLSLQSYKHSSVCEFQWSVGSLDLSNPPSVWLAAGPCFSADCWFGVQRSSASPANILSFSADAETRLSLRGDQILSALADPWLALTPEVNVSQRHHVTNETPVLLMNTDTIQRLFKDEVTGTLRNMIFTAMNWVF